MVEAASYKTPNQLQHITYKDKAAPPKDWSQFVLDPIPMQQLYDKLFKQMDQEALTAAANIRSFLDLPELLPPPKKEPDIDPVRFQRLDHFFVRRQWLSSVLSLKL